MRYINAWLAAILLAFLLPGQSADAGQKVRLDLDNADSLSFGDFGGGQPLFQGFHNRNERALLNVSVVPESGTVAPGTPFKVLVKLDHADGAYSYWTNPGGPGMGTKVAWSLPKGFAITATEWPTPQHYQSGGMTFYTYKGKTDLVYTITPPGNLKQGAEFDLKVDIDTQICTPSNCNPLRQEATARVVAGAKPGASAPELASALARLPVAPKSWRFEAADYDGEIVLAMYPSPGSNPDPTDIHFFDSQAKPFVDSQKEQRVEKEGGVWWLRLPRQPGPSRIGENLTGVVSAKNGWLDAPDSPTGFLLDLPIHGEGTGRPPGLQRGVENRVWVLMLFAFFGGLLLNVMPCVFPVIGLKIMGFAKQAHKERRAVFLHGLSYAAGVLICFWTLSILVITMGRGWGAQLQSDWFMFVLCHVFMIMSLNMAGVFEVGAAVSGAGQSLGGREGLKRSFFTGLLATITSTPCSAPFLGTALAYALSLPPLLSLGMFTLMGVGFAFPYLALSLFPNWLKKLPKPGPWMDTFRQAMCFPLFATTAYLFWTMEAMMAEWHFLMFLFGLVLTAMACWLYGKYQKSQLRRPRTSRTLMGLAVFSLAAGIWLGMPKIMDDDLQWQEWSPETVSRLRDEGRPVYVDFTARWCATCQLNKRIYNNSDLRDLIREKKVALLKADWTMYDERITSTLRSEFNKAAVPVNVLYKPGEDRGSLLPDLLTVENVGEELRALP